VQFVCAKKTNLLSNVMSDLRLNTHLFPVIISLKTHYTSSAVNTQNDRTDVITAVY